MSVAASAKEPGERDRDERLVVLGSLVSGLAHEIRTPLAAAMNHLSLLQRRLAGPLPPETPLAVELVLEGARDEVAPTDGALRAARRIVERHGGAVTWRVEPGRGSVFVLSLPKRPLPEMPVT